MRSVVHYSAIELAWIKQRKSMVRRKAHAKFVETFKRPDVSLSNYTALCKRNKWFTGRTGMFVKGQVSPNKGKKMPFNARSAATQFKKGQLPHNTKFEGHERINTDGYVEISIPENNPHTGFERRYVHKHRLLWERLHGPVPNDHVLKCLDGNKANSDPSNWECISRSMLPRLTNQWGRNFETAEPEVKPTIMAIAKLENAISQKAQEA